MITLITGGGGYIGQRIARQLGGDVLLWTHRPLEDSPFPFVCGDIADDDPFSGVDPASIRRIVHSAAVTRFNVDRETAERVNVEGTRKILRFAARCPALESIDILSTIYVAGLQEGEIAEERAGAAAGFANEYERSKWLAEEILLNDFAHLPWRIQRIATVIADDDDGHVLQHNAVHNTLKLLYYGLMSLVPGRPEVPLYFVTADFVARSIAAVLAGGPLRSIFHVSHTREESLTLGEFIDTVFAVFETDPKFLTRRALKPLYTDAESFDMMVRQVSGFSSGILGQAAGSVAPFARELFSVKAFRNDRLRSAGAIPPAPDPKQLVENVCRDLIASRFGTAHAAH